VPIIQGKLIVFSGLDGAGKSTQIQLLMEELKQRGKTPLYLWTRGGYTPLFSACKTFLRHVLKRKLPLPGRSERREKAFRKVWVRDIWLVLAILDLILVYGVYIRVYKVLGRIVIADRYVWDTWIDFILGFPEAYVDRWVIWKILKKIAPRPELTFLLLIPVKEALIRSRMKNEPFPDSEDILRKRRDIYSNISHKVKYVMPDCLQPIEVVQEAILKNLSEILN
jgi:thymidylate kinase